MARGRPRKKNKKQFASAKIEIDVYDLIMDLKGDNTVSEFIFDCVVNYNPEKCQTMIEKLRRGGK